MNRITSAFIKSSKSSVTLFQNKNISTLKNCFPLKNLSKSFDMKNYIQKRQTLPQKLILFFFLSKSFASSNLIENSSLMRILSGHNYLLLLQAMGTIDGDDEES